MRTKNYILYGVIVLLICGIFFLIINSNANDTLDKYEKHDLKQEKHVSLQQPKSNQTENKKSALHASLKNDTSNQTAHTSQNNQQVALDGGQSHEYLQ
ncbi:MULTISPECIES: hypothetical protein [Staphylococcus]|uniref:Uncharacterized protein n=1 Tax=Staphylococcus agnetis TaxID=985762 RepID=A0A085UG18_9STAP|nr:MULTISPECIES: hypothetical protein [Staphylococcus]ALN77400.1 hypothetical protein EP23_08575 [Staphylococcus agnetis]KFE42131.1 hypothetical protein SAGN_04875 [Staphylococcus agnetis]MBY7664392.1 hypothetical protein [Staphylococcus agnetis]MCO4325747.1 hypothetical protein [Staphylococcus agnetis]MCO4339661.1 hypothetical protein [Staphylococcus agnetis]